MALTVTVATVSGEYFKPFTVSYDHRAYVIDGQQRMLISVGIHYPRAIPQLITMTDPNEEDDNNNRWSLEEEMKKVFEIALERSFPNLSEEADPCIIDITKKEIGDYECDNVSTICLKELPQNMLLKRTAEAIKNNLPPNDMIEDCSIQSIGFLTFRLSRTWIAKNVHKMLNEGIETWAPKLPMKTAVVNFLSRNLAKEMDVGHLRSPMIGHTLARMLDFSNVNVRLINHPGDRTEFGMLLEFLQENPDKGQHIGEFEVFYNESKRRFDEDAEFRERAHHALLGHQTGDGGCLDALAYICHKNRILYETVYELLGIHVDETGEHYYYYPHHQETLNILRREKGLIEESEGDTVIFVEEKKTVRHFIYERLKKPLTVLNKNGVFDNALADLTVLRYQLKEQIAEWIVYVADIGEKDYFEMCFAAARRAGWLPTDEDEYPGTKFVGYGHVQGDDLNRSVKLVDLLVDVRTRCKAALVERVEADNLTSKELDITAEALGYGALKYALMKHGRVFNYTLNVDEMLSDKGNTGVYLLYTYAQICSIINKSGKDVEKLKKTRELMLEKDEERELGLHLLEVTGVLELSCTAVLPSYLCAYLYELCKKFTSFYSVVHQTVGGADEEANKLLVCEATRVVMAKCFYLLGITPLDNISMTMPPLVERDDDVVLERRSSDEDIDEMLSSSSSSSGENKEVIVSSSSGEEKTPAKRFKSSDLTLEEEEEIEEQAEKKRTPSPQPIESSDLTLEEKRFQLFSVHVHVDMYESECKPCFLFGYISVSDMFVSSVENGWEPGVYDPDFCYTDLFRRDWYEPLPIVNNGHINVLIHPMTQRSIPFIDFIRIRTDMCVFSKDDNILFQVSNSSTLLGLSNVIYDKFRTHILHGHDGFVKLAFIVLSDAVDAALEMTLTPHPLADFVVSKKPLSVKIFAYYGGDYGSTKDRYYITLLEDDSVTMFDKTVIALNTSLLAVPANGSLVIDVVIKDSSKSVIVEKIFHLSAKHKGSSSTAFVEGEGCGFNLKVNWR